MRALNFTRTLFAALAVVALTGCGYNAGDACERWCEVVNRCEDGGPNEPVDCGDESADMTACVDSVEDVSEGCQDAWGVYYDCLEGVDSCSDTEQDRECGAEQGEVIENCAGEENPFNRIDLP